MNENPTARRFENVSFRFLGSHEDTTLSGFVIVRSDEMILMIPRSPSGPYHIAGKLTKSVYRGVNTDDDRHDDAKVAWADLGDIFVGRWLESGYEYLFSFELRATH